MSGDDVTRPPIAEPRRLASIMRTCGPDPSAARPAAGAPKMSNRDERHTATISARVRSVRCDVCNARRISMSAREQDAVRTEAGPGDPPPLLAARGQPGAVRHAEPQVGAAPRARDPGAPPRRDPQHRHAPAGRRRAARRGVGRPREAGVAGPVQGRRRHHRPRRRNRPARRRAARQPRADAAAPRLAAARSCPSRS